MLTQLIAMMLRPTSNTSFSVNALRALTYSLPFVLELYTSSKVGICKEDDITELVIVDFHVALTFPEVIKD